MLFYPCPSCCFLAPFPASFLLSSRGGSCGVLSNWPGDNDHVRLSPLGGFSFNVMHVLVLLYQVS